MDRKMLVFGNSITYGAWDKKGGWVQRLREFIDGKNLSDPDFYCLIYNQGVSGDITDDLIERFDLETRKRTDEDEEKIILFSIGINDTQFLHKENHFRTSMEKIF